MSWYDRVLWFEGMFLQPQHFQQHDRYIERLLRGTHRPRCRRHSWGFSHLEIDEDGARAWKGVIGRPQPEYCPDGTPFDCPNAMHSRPALDIPADARDELVVLALPIRRGGAGRERATETAIQALSRDFATSELEVAGRQRRLRSARRPHSDRAASYCALRWRRAPPSA